VLELLTKLLVAAAQLSVVVADTAAAVAAAVIGQSTAHTSNEQTSETVCGLCTMKFPRHHLRCTVRMSACLIELPLRCSSMHEPHAYSVKLTAINCAEVK
jgi:hypothetical protein